MSDEIVRALRLRDVLAMSGLPTEEVAEQRRLLDRVREALAGSPTLAELADLEAELNKARGLNARVDAQLRRGGRT